MKDFFTNPAKINVLRKILIVAFAVILLKNIYDIINGLTDDYSKIIIPVVFILMMIFSIRRTNMNAANNSNPKS